jgi:hypothetical protein
MAAVKETMKKMPEGMTFGEHASPSKIVALSVALPHAELHVCGETSTSMSISMSIQFVHPRFGYSPVRTTHDTRTRLGAHEGRTGFGELLRS